MMNATQSLLVQSIAPYIPREAWDVVCIKFDVRPSEAREVIAAVIASWPSLTLSHPSTPEPFDRIVLPVKRYANNAEAR